MVDLGFLSRLSWVVRTKTELGAARELGVSQPTISRYLTGLIDIPDWRLPMIDRMYERTQYEQFRARGLSPEIAAGYRGILPETTDMWLSRMESIVDTFTRGMVINRALGEGIDFMDMTEEEIEDYMWRAESDMRDALDESGKDIEDFEQY